MYSGRLALLLAVALLALLTTSFPTLERRGPQCTDFKIPVQASAPTKILLPPPDLSQLYDPNFLVDYILAQSSTSAAAGGVGTLITSGTYLIAIRYCEPEIYNATRAHTIQYLQHAITNTKDYWNGLTYPTGFMGDKYSWIAYASKEGYPTLSVDNLGSGDSDRPDPLLVTQMTLQVEIIHKILTMLRQGTIPHPVLTGRSFSKIIYTGHSYGSICGNAIATNHPSDIDALILTGYSRNFKTGLGPLAAGIAIPAAIARPDRFLSLLLKPLYLAQSLPEGRRIGLYAGSYDPSVPLYDFQNEGTVSLGELATLFYGVQPAPQFVGDVLVLTGKKDAIVCNNLPEPDCGMGVTSIPEKAREFFSNARNFKVYIPEETGHSPNLHLSGPGSFKFAHNYLEGRGF